MSKHVLNAACSRCKAAIMVKTRALEKTVACPKCGESITVSAAPAAATKDLPFAMRLDAPPLPMAEPLTLPFAQPLTPTLRCTPKQIRIAGAIGGGVLVAALLLIVLQPGAGQPQQTSSQSVAGNTAKTDVTAVTQVTSQKASAASQAVEDSEKSADAEVQTQSEPEVTQEGGNYFEALSNAQIKQAQNKQAQNNPFNSGGNGFPGGGFQNLSPRDQQRNWDLANSGRLGAMGLKKVQMPRR